MKIGLVGYNCQSGLGELNRQLATHLPIAQWAVQRHKSFPGSIDWLGTRCFWLQPNCITEFVRNVDLVLFAETPFYWELLQACKVLKTPSVCIPMQEWMPQPGTQWTPLVNLYICPTVHCYQQFKNVLPCTCFPWPIDTSRFQYRQRSICRSFLFVNGHGGWRGRKGSKTVIEAKQIWPEMPLIVCSQQPQEWTKGTIILQPPSDNSDLYNQGDVLLAPHSTDGIGLELLEAAACGMPLITTAGEPWDEYSAIGRISAFPRTVRIKREVTWYDPSPESLVQVCKELLGQDISQKSLTVRREMERRSWNRLAGSLENLLFRAYSE